MTIEQGERLAAQTEEERKERFKQDLLLMGATEEEVEERFQTVWGNKTKSSMMNELKKSYPTIEEYATGKYFQAREVKAEMPTITNTDWYEINGLRREDFF